MTGQIIANALCSVSGSKDQVLEALNWMMDNGLVQHLQEALTSASKGSLGDEVAIPWFIAQFERVSHACGFSWRLTDVVVASSARRETHPLHHEAVSQKSRVTLMQELIFDLFCQDSQSLLRECENGKDDRIA